MTDIRVYAGHHEAKKIADSTLLAFWTGETSENPGHHLNEVRSSFEELAEKLGYRVERITEESTKSGKYCEVCGGEMQPDCPHGHTQVLETA